MDGMGRMVHLSNNNAASKKQYPAGVVFGKFSLFNQLLSERHPKFAAFFIPRPNVVAAAAAAIGLAWIGLELRFYDNCRCCCGPAHVKRLPQLGKTQLVFGWGHTTTMEGRNVFVCGTSLCILWAIYCIARCTFYLTCQHLPLVRALLLYLCVLQSGSPVSFWKARSATARRNFAPHTQKWPRRTSSPGGACTLVAPTFSNMVSTTAKCSDSASDTRRTG